MQQKRHRDTFVRHNIKLRTEPDLAEVATKLEALRLEDRVDQERKVGILRFPAETMIEIFKYSQLISEDDSVDNHQQEDGEDSDWCWITFTHVCRYWRNIAINTQELWTYINISKLASPGQTKVYLERSRNAPLHIYYDHDDARINRDSHISLCFALLHIHRIRELHIRKRRHLDLRLEDQFSLEFIDYPAPMLEIFSLKMGTDVVFNITPFFGGQSPRLTSLSLYTKPHTWERVSMMQNLRHLTIGFPLDLDELIFIASQNREYETLYVFLLQGLTFQERYPVQSHITMPSMKNLEIPSASYIVLSRLFQRIDFPAADSWYIRCEDYPLKIGVVADPKDVLPCTSDIGHISLKLIISRDFVEITANSLKTATERNELRRSVVYTWFSHFGLPVKDITISDSFEFVISVVKGGFWTRATELAVDVCSYCSEDLVYERIDDNDWRSLLRHFPHVTKITVTHLWTNYLDVVHFSRKETHYGVLKALGSSSNDGGDSVILCPKLAELHLYGFNLFDPYGAERRIKFLNYRNKCGKKLALLRVVGLPKNQSSYAHLNVLRDSGVARTIEVIV